VKKKLIISFQPTDKVAGYLEVLGFLDRRTGRKKKSAPSPSSLINEAIVRVLEAGKSAWNSKASPQDLAINYIRLQVADLNKEQDCLNHRMAKLKVAKEETLLKKEQLEVQDYGR